MPGPSKGQGYRGTGNDQLAPEEQGARSPDSGPNLLSRDH